jgi:hypothetical protein
MTIARTLTALAALGAVAAIPASAQNPNGRPNFGEISLSGGFTPDPARINLQAGGNIDASRSLGGACRGFVTEAPDVRLNWQSGSLPLYISAYSNADTTLVINAPDGRFYCVDDSNGLNPALRFDNPASGRYEIWVGTYNSGGLAPAQLRISELGS